MINIEQTTDTIDNIMKPKSLKLYKFNLDHFVEKNLPIMIDYLQRHSNKGTFKVRIGVTTNGKIVVGKFINNIEPYNFKNRTIFGITNLHTTIADTKTSAINILNEYYDWLTKLIKRERQLSVNQLSKFDYDMLVTEGLFSAQAYADFIIPRLSVITERSKLDLDYLTYNNEDCNYFLYKLMMALPKYQQLAARTIDELISYLLYVSGRNWLSIDKGLFTIVAQRLYELISSVNPVKIRFSKSYGIKYADLISLLPNSQVVQLPLSAIASFLFANDETYKQFYQKRELFKFTAFNQDDIDILMLDVLYCYGVQHEIPLKERLLTVKQVAMSSTLKRYFNNKINAIHDPDHKNECYIKELYRCLL